jgi:hypothetical protein
MRRISFPDHRLVAGMTELNSTFGVLGVPPPFFRRTILLPNGLSRQLEQVENKDQALGLGVR